MSIKQENDLQAGHGTPFLSVIVPVYNAEKTIGKCLDSIMRLKYPQDKLEVIVIDDGSTDDTLHVVKQYPIELIAKKRGGPSSAMNIGIKAAKGEIILNIDSDTYIDQDWLSNALPEFVDPRVGIVGGRIDLASTHSFWAKLVSYDSEYREDKAIQKSKYTDHMTTTCTAFRRWLFEEIGFFDEKIINGYDLDLSHRAFKSGWKLVVQKDAVCYHDFKTSFRSYFRQHHFEEGWYQLKLILKHPELVYGKRVFPSRLYIPLFLASFLFIIPFLFFTDRIALFSLVLSLFILYHSPETIKILKKHREWIMLLFPIAILVRYIAWVVGFASSLGDEMVSSFKGR